jgi:Family of unknown function (DUF5406)
MTCYAGNGEGLTMTTITTYDPNIQWARHSFELVLMQWDYSLTVNVDVCGNCKGATLFDSAVSAAFDDLYDEDEDNARIVLKRPAEDGNGGEDTLEVDLEDIEDLEKLCVSVRITGHTNEEA